MRPAASTRPHQPAEAASVLLSWYGPSFNSRQRRINAVTGRDLEQRRIGFCPVDGSQTVHRLAKTGVVSFAENNDLEIRRKPNLIDDLQGALIADLTRRDCNRGTGALGSDAFYFLRAEI